MPRKEGKKKRQKNTVNILCVGLCDEIVFNFITPNLILKIPHIEQKLMQIKEFMHIMK